MNQKWREQENARRKRVMFFGGLAAVAIAGLDALAVNSIIKEAKEQEARRQKEYVQYLEENKEKIEARDYWLSSIDSFMNWTVGKGLDVIDETFDWKRNKRFKFSANSQVNLGNEEYPISITYQANGDTFDFHFFSYSSESLEYTIGLRRDFFGRDNRKDLDWSKLPYEYLVDSSGNQINDTNAIANAEKLARRLFEEYRSTVQTEYSNRQDRAKQQLVNLLNQTNN